MGKITTAVSIIAPIIGIVLGAILIMNNQERLTELDEKQKELNIKFDVALNNVIIRCSEEPDTECDVGLLKFYESCQESYNKESKVCHDGRIEQYLKERGLR